MSHSAEPTGSRSSAAAETLSFPTTQCVIIHVKMHLGRTRLFQFAPVRMSQFAKSTPITIRLVSSCVCALLLATCAPSKNDMVGTYELKSGAHSGTLILASGGHGTEVTKTRKGGRIELTETWTLHGRTLYRTPCVHFEVDGEGTGEGESMANACSQSVNRTTKGVTIEVASDFGLVYERR